MKWLNDPRGRSASAGALGGLLGWILAELFYGAPQSFGGAVVVGIVVGLGIGLLLGAAEGIAIQSQKLATRGAVVGLVIGIVGGAVGAAFAQFSYAAAVHEEAIDGSDKTVTEGTVFSSEVRKRLEQAGARSGEIEIALSWQNKNDLDLHVIDPAGERIYFNNKRSDSGGELDVDQNAACVRRVTNEPVEHVVWGEETAPEGTYNIYVNHYQNCGISDPTSFHVEVKVGDDSRGSYDRSISHGGPPMSITEFSYDPRSQPAAGRAVEERRVGAFWPRILGWALFGALLGCAEGLTRRSVKALRNGGLGGLIGGALGGVFFQLIASSGFSDAASRFLGFVLLGACIGLGIVLVEQALSAILSVRSGRFEGRQIFLDKAVMRIGQDDALEIYLGGDPQIASHHATLQTEGGHHVITAQEGSVDVNDAPVSRQTLQDGDRITIGKTRIGYRRKGAGEAPPTPSPTPSQSQASRQAPPPLPKSTTQSHSGTLTAQDTQSQSEEKSAEPAPERRETDRGKAKPPPPPPKKQ